MRVMFLIVAALITTSLPAAARGRVFVRGCGAWYGPWYSAWYYSPPTYYGPSYQFSPPSATTPVSSVSTNEPPEYTTGYLWGLDLRLGLVKNKDARRALQSYWPTAPPAMRDSFRRGFVAGYGIEGEAEFDKLLEKAKLPRE